MDANPDPGGSSVAPVGGGVGGLDAAVAEAVRLFGDRPKVRTIEPGWEFAQGWITDRRAVVLVVDNLSPDELGSFDMPPLPGEILGVPLNVRVASLEEVTPELVLDEQAAGWQSTYEPLADQAMLLGEVSESMSVTLHSSPDAGWAVLSGFLTRTSQRLTVGMYDFTAPHIVSEITAVMSPKGRLFSLVLGRGEVLGTGTKKDDIPEQETVDSLSQRMGARFEQAWAVTRGAASPFKTAYHIKVAVRDSSAFWLSSGNWQSSNQPNADPLGSGDTTPPLLSTHNRDWHVVVESPKLAQAFEKYLEHDLNQAGTAGVDVALDFNVMVWVPAGFVQPTASELGAIPSYTEPLIIQRKLRVQPLLTPDNYWEHALALIESANERVYFQNQSLSILEENPDHFKQLLETLLGKQKAGLDVRIIIRRIGELRRTVSAIRDFGFDTDQLRLQTNCHTKGIVVDGKAVLIGSHNWTGDGTGFNRDASLIFFDEEVANYFEELFLYDWDRIGKPRIDESLFVPEVADQSDFGSRPGMVLMTLEEWRGET